MALIQPSLGLVGLLVGFVVGLTGMGGGALMTPLLVLGFGVPPLTAVSSDLVASALMKPVGASVHLRRGTVDRRLAFWLVAGSVPASFAAAFGLSRLGADARLETGVRVALGAALVVVSLGLVVKQLLSRREPLGPDDAPVAVKPWATLAIGAIGGLVVGVTSVGSGSLMMLLLLLLHPGLRLGRLVGTDLVQAVPLVTAAAVAHALFGHVDVSLTLSIALGALPGVYCGARLSAVAPDRWIRPALVVLLLASGMKLLGVGTAATLLVTGGLVTAAALACLLARRRPRARTSAAAPEHG